jgi:hypothetical protein
MGIFRDIRRKIASDMKHLGPGGVKEFAPKFVAAREIAAAVASLK